MHKSALFIIGIAVALFIIAMSYRVFLGDGGTAKVGDIELNIGRLNDDIGEKEAANIPSTQCEQHRDIEGIWADDNQLSVFQINLIKDTKNQKCDVTINSLDFGYRGDYRGITYVNKKLQFTRFRKNAVPEGFSVSLVAPDILLGKSDLTEGVRWNRKR